MTITRRIKLAIMGFISLAGAVWFAPVQAQALQTVDNTTMPSTIRVAIRANNDPRGQILWVQTLGFKEYCEDVLPNEWMPDWNGESLRAGAIAIKMFGWFHSLHPITEDGFTFDVDNTTNFQEFKYKTGRLVTNQAINDTWRIVFVPANKEVKALDYRAGYPDNPNWAFVRSNRMAQWGSQYWASVAGLPYLSILNLYYPNHDLHWI